MYDTNLKEDPSMRSGLGGNKSRLDTEVYFTTSVNARFVKVQISSRVFMTSVSLIKRDTRK